MLSKFDKVDWKELWNTQSQVCNLVCRQERIQETFEQNKLLYSTSYFIAEPKNN